ncbi:hypothetical protein [Chryseobacterium caseinilyticum]|uniref:DUF4845 domain-containing protein n=1 Tax=Chryseobacterium caseinilyticum TaxID=2771428 RepID=A0ABR8ZAN1_9FLAO|nr:hypothetical protein [Chryseobacterium caseinilyticum]MBD8082291.1 hypothetical protein [Chryseobacterium caseinilyticum]
MKNKIWIFIFLMLIASFTFTLYLENKLLAAFSKINAKSIQNLEHVSNKNFSENYIENIGLSLQQELLRMNVNKCKLTVRKDYFFFFQNKAVFIENKEKYLRVSTEYNTSESMFSIKGFQAWK